MPLEDRFIYFPSRQLVGTPADVGLPFEEVRFGEGARLHGWFVPGAGGITLLWFHGNAGNISHRLDWVKTVHSSLGSNIFIFDYQGYGLSAGVPSEKNAYEDARAALQYLHSRPDVDRGRIVYYGKSLGSAVAVQLATEESPHRLALQSPFTSALDMARLHYPFLPVGALVRTRFSILEKLSAIRVPILIIHGDADEVVPIEHARRLYQAAGHPKRLVVIEGAGHNDIFRVGRETYLEALAEFCR